MDSSNKNHFFKLLLPPLLILLLGSGCMKVDMAIVVETDGTGFYTGDIAMTKAMTEIFDEGGEGNDTEICEGLLNPDDDNSFLPDVGAEAKEENYEDDEWCGVNFSVNFTDFGKSLAEQDPDDEFPLSIVGNTLTFFLATDELLGEDSPLSGDDAGLDDGMNLELILEAFDIPEPEFKIRVTLPGKILEHNATSQNGSTLTWEIDVFESAETPVDSFAIADISKSPEGGSSRIGIIVGVAVVAGIIMLAGLNFVKKRQEISVQDSVL